MLCWSTCLGTLCVAHDARCADTPIRSHLCAPFPSQIMFSFFFLGAAAWSWLVYKQRSHAQHIHYLMAALAIAKTLTLLSQACMVHFVERTGSADGWNIVYYIFTFFRGMLFFSVVVLIGTGWSYMKVGAKRGCGSTEVGVGGDGKLVTT